MSEVNEYFKEKYEDKFKEDSAQEEKAVDSENEKKPAKKRAWQSDDNKISNKITDTKEEFEKKIRKHKMAHLYRSVIAILIILVLVILAYYNYKKMVYTDYDVTRKVTYMESSNARYLKFNGNILRYSQDGASAFNISNDMIWNETYEMQNPIADTCGDFVALGDYMGTTIYVFNSEGLKGTIDTSTPLRSFCVSGTGNVAVVLEEEDVTWVKLFDYSGVNIASDRTTMAKSGYPVKIDISEDGIILSISYLFVDSGVLSSSVAFYNFGAVGQNEIDNLVSGYTYSNTIVSHLAFMNADTAFGVGDNCFVIYKGNQKPESIYEKEIDEEILSVFNNDEYVGLVFDDEGGENIFRIDVYDDEGNPVCSQGFDLEYNDIEFFKDLIVIYNSEECEMYSIDGLKKYTGGFEKPAILMVPETRARHLVVSGDIMEEIKLK